MTYVQSTLTPGERIVFEAFPSLIAMAPRLVIGAVLMLLGVVLSFGESPGAGVATFVVGAITFGMVAIAYRTTELTITNKRVVAKFGVIRRSTVELQLSRVESVQVEQGILGRMLHYGSLVVAGAGLPSAPIPAISEPMAFRAALFRAIEQPASPELKLAA
ncbi:PH domain-containing protein [Paraburkholderia pallida]|nr:PH domain-containing protein [Paraburkholderia pallida]